MPFPVDDDRRRREGGHFGLQQVTADVNGRDSELEFRQPVGRTGEGYGDEDV